MNGVGLGLVISKQIVHQFDGDITVDSKVGVGSVFTFTISLIEEIR
jgi:signal transduction histidine kinase